MSMELNLNKATILFLFAIIWLWLILPTGIVNLFLFTGVVIFSYYTRRRMNKKVWPNEAITKAERGRLVYLIAIYASTYLCLESYWIINAQGNSIGDTADMAWALLEICQGILLLYTIFQVNLELNHYGNQDYNEEGVFTRFIKGRAYQQSNQGDK